MKIDLINDVKIMNEELGYGNGTCSYCKRHADVRPYGKDEADICFDCAHKPENWEMAERNKIRAIAEWKDVYMPEEVEDEIIEKMRQHPDFGPRTIH